MPPNPQGVRGHPVRGPLLNKEGKLGQNTLDMAQILNEYFGTVFTKELELNEEWSRKFERIGDSTDLISDITITEDKIIKALSGLKRNKCGGIDSFNSTMLIECGTAMIQPLKQLFDNSISQEKFQRIGD